MGIVVVVAESYREDLDWKRWIRREKRGYGSFYVYPEGHGGESKKKGGKCDFSSLLFLTFLSGFWVKVNASKCGSCTTTTILLNLIYLHGWICILDWLVFFLRDFSEPPQIKFKCGLNSNEDFFLVLPVTCVIVCVAIANPFFHAR